MSSCNKIAKIGREIVEETAPKATKVVQEATQKTTAKEATEEIAEKTAKKLSSPVKAVKSRFLKSKLSKSLIQKELKEIIAKGPIKLSEKELKYVLENPKQIRNIIKLKVGDNKSFQEFFIRLAMSDKKQVELLLDNPAIKEYIKKSIRRSGEGGVHEWLMTKNFKDFLINPKWGNDGPFLALTLTKLVQKTENIIFKTGGGHVAASRANNSASIAFHNGLSKVIDNCSTKEELFLAVKSYAKKKLSKDAYKEFVSIFGEVFS